MALTVAPGFVDLMELADQRVTEVGVQTVEDAIQMSVNLYLAESNKMLSALVERTTKFKEKIDVPAATELQPLHGDRDRPRPAGQLYSFDQGYPLWSAGHAWGGGRITRAKMTVAEANKFTVQALTADSNWLIRHVLHALFYDNSFTYADEAHGDLTVVPLANSDTQEYVLYNGTTATDTHYLAQADAIDDTHNPFPDINAELTEHPENTGEVVVYIPTNLKATVTALGGFVDNQHPALIPGSATDTLAYLPNFPVGEKVLGIVDDCWIVEWRRLPSSYMVATMVGGDPFLAMRQEPEAELQGLILEKYSDGGVNLENGFIRMAGFSPQRRTGAVVYRVGDAAYVPPSGYDVAKTLPS
jgi:hypothetical protein